VGHRAVLVSIPLDRTGIVPLILRYVFALHKEDPDAAVKMPKTTK